MLYKKPEQLELDELITAGEAWMGQHPEDYKFRESLDGLKRNRDLLNQGVKPDVPPVPYSAFPAAPQAKDYSAIIPVSSEQKLADNSETSSLNSKDGINTGMAVAGAMAVVMGIPFLVYIFSDENRRTKAMNFLSTLREECKKDVQYYAPPPIPGYDKKFNSLKTRILL